ncbi:MAG TPA: HmuY family protein [Flavobacteriales bacterium]
MKAIGTLGGAAVMLLVSGCLRDELPVPRRDPGAAVAAQVCVGPDYGSQVWFDIGTNSEVARNSKMAWDLAFEGDASGWQVRLNSARSMRAIVTTQTDITQPTDTNGFASGWRIDHPEGSRDSTAVGDWRSHGRVCVIDLGFNAFGAPVGLRKLQVVSVSDTGYRIRIARLNGSDLQEIDLSKDPQRRFFHFLFSSAEVVTIAPPDGRYDLVFTQYTTQFYDPYMPYMVTGVVNGFSGLRAAEWITSDFAAVSLDDTLTHPMGAAEDVVGYDWKEYNFNTSVYDIFPDHVFVVQDAEGLYHKLHFVDFYDENGQRGCPKFEVVSF